MLSTDVGEASKEGLFWMEGSTFLGGVWEVELLSGVFRGGSTFSLFFSESDPDPNLTKTDSLFLFVYLLISSFD